MRLSGEVEFEFKDDGHGGSSFVATNQIRGVILRHLTSGQIASAATLLVTAAPEVGEALLAEDAATASVALKTAMAEMFMHARDFARAGRAALMLGDPARAAPFFERAGQVEQAARLYEQGGQLDRAAELWERTLQWDRAALLYDRLGKRDRAANALERQGKHYDAGKAWAALKRLDKAVDCLQRVDANQPDWIPAMSLLGAILEKAGHREAAGARYLEVARAKPVVDGSTVAIFERLAAIYAAGGETGGARRLVDMVLTFDPTRTSAQELRASLIKAARPPVPTGQAPARPPKPGMTAPQGGHVAHGHPPARPHPPPRPPTASSASHAPSSPATSPSTAPSASPSFAPPSHAPVRVASSEAPSAISDSHIVSAEPLAPLQLPPMNAASPQMTALHRNVDVLRNLPIFGELSLDELRDMHALGERVMFAERSVLVEQGRPATHLFVILSGTAVVQLSDGAQTRTLAELGTGAPIGEMAFVDEGPTSARVVAKTDVSLFRWPTGELRQYLDAHDRTALQILRVLSRTLSIRLREANRRG